MTPVIYRKSFTGLKYRIKNILWSVMETQLVGNQLIIQIIEKKIKENFQK